MTKTLEEKVDQWFVDRNLHEANPVKQFEKLMEESGELFEGIAKDKPELIKDALGDMRVVIIGLLLQLNRGNKPEAANRELLLLELVKHIGNMAGKILLHIENKNTEKISVGVELLGINRTMQYIALYSDTTLTDCLQIAYDKIKDRKGKMINGVFVKEEDLK
ncbi:MazG-like family protein [Streptococcus sp. ZY19097]|uniref:MazG-like family protein n=1 Tax=Streptococcus sp. ZY19097 TaxID=3231906 RepID=UPI00345A6CC3